MRNWYGRRIDEWEMQLAFRATNRVVRPFDWGVEWTRGWPQGVPLNGHSPEHYLLDLNRAAMANSDGFFAYEKPTDFQLEGDILRFTTPAPTPYPENDVVHARYFPAKGNKAVALLPHWNAPADGHLGLCRGLQKLGITTLRHQPALSRFPDAAGTPASRLRRLFEHWAELWMRPGRPSSMSAAATTGWRRKATIASGSSAQAGVHVMPASCRAHDSRVKVNVFNHCSTYFADVVWTGLSTRHIRQGLEGHVDLDRLRDLWRAISPVSYMDKFSRQKQKSQFIYTLTTPPSCPSFPGTLSRKWKSTESTIKSWYCRAGTTRWARLHLSSWSAITSARTRRGIYKCLPAGSG